MYLKMLLIDNLMHADLHPGNILVQSLNGDNYDGDCRKSKRIMLVDAGMIAGNVM